MGRLNWKLLLPVCLLVCALPAGFATYILFGGQGPGFMKGVWVTGAIGALGLIMLVWWAFTEVARQNLAKLIVRGLVLGSIVAFFMICSGLVNHWVDYDTGSSDPKVLEASSHMISVHYDYGFPLRLFDNSLGFGSHSYPLPTYHYPQWANLVGDAIFWSVIAFLILSLFRYIVRRNNQS